MTPKVSDVAFTPAVKAEQEQLGSRRIYAGVEGKGGFRNRVNSMLEAFIAERDSFYLGTASAKGLPYIQHRGGPKGFLKVLDPSTLAFADYSGNRQYISLGNLSENDHAYLFLMDYPNRQRVKIWGRAEVVEEDAGLLDRLVDPAYPARPERAIVFHIDAWDINCPQHIRPRFTEEELAPIVEKLQARIEALEAELTAIRSTTESDPATNMKTDWPQRSVGSQ